MKLVNIGPGNGLAPLWYQAITWISFHSLTIGLLEQTSMKFVLVTTGWSLWKMTGPLNCGIFFCWVSNQEYLQRKNNGLLSMTSSNWNIFRVTGPLWEEFISHRWIPLTMPVMRSYDVFFDLCLNKRLGKQSRRRWFETPLRPFWRHCIVSTCQHLLELCYQY